MARRRRHSGRTVAGIGGVVVPFPANRASGRDYNGAAMQTRDSTLGGADRTVPARQLGSETAPQRARIRAGNAAPRAEGDGSARLHDIERPRGRVEERHHRLRLGRAHHLRGDPHQHRRRDSPYAGRRRTPPALHRNHPETGISPGNARRTGLVIDRRRRASLTSAAKGHLVLRDRGCPACHGGGDGLRLADAKKPARPRAGCGGVVRQPNRR